MLYVPDKLVCKSRCCPQRWDNKVRLKTWRAKALYSVCCVCARPPPPINRAGGVARSAEFLHTNPLRSHRNVQCTAIAAFNSSYHSTHRAALATSLNRAFELRVRSRNEAPVETAISLALQSSQNFRENATIGVHFNGKRRCDECAFFASKNRRLQCVELCEERRAGPEINVDEQEMSRCHTSNRLVSQ